MPTLVPADMSELTITRLASRSEPIVNEFLESDLEVALVDVSDLDKGAAGIATTLNLYITKRNVPVRVAQRQGQVYLVRMTDEEVEARSAAQAARQAAAVEAEAAGTPKPKRGRKAKAESNGNETA